MGLSGCGSSPAAATVNGATISRSAFQGELSDIRRNTAALAQLEQQGPIAGSAYDGFSRSFVAQVLSNDIQAVLVADAVHARHLSAPVAVASALSAAAGGGYSRYPNSYQRVIARRTANRLALAAGLSGVKLNSAAIQTYYRSNLSEFTQYCVSGLALDSKTIAAGVRARLVAGADLAATARSQSVDPNTAGDGGVLGCGDIGVFPALATPVTSLPVGTFSQPVQVGQVWYVVKVTRRDVRPMAQAEPTIVQDLITQYGPFNTYLEKALSTAKVTVEAQYGHFDRSMSPPAVAPPP